MPRPATIVLLSLLIAHNIAADSPAQGTLDDYRRADALPALVRGKVFRSRVRPHWSDDGRRLWYRNDLPGEATEYIVVEVEEGRRRPAFDHARLAEALEKVAGGGPAADRLPIDGLDWAGPDGALLVRTGTKWWRLDAESYALTPEERELPAGRRRVAAVPRASRRTGDETEIVVVNRTEGPLRLVWLDTEGRPQPYGTLKPGDERRQHTFAGHVWSVVDPDGREVDRFEAEDPPARFEVAPGGSPPPTPAPERRRRGQARGGASSPDGRWEAFVREHDLYLRDLDSKEEFRLTEDGRESDGYEPRFQWSPDSSRLVASRRKAGDDRKVYLIESSPRDQLQPKLDSYDYLKPGDTLPISKPHLFDVVERREIPVDDALFENPWSLGELRWEPDSSRFTFLFNQRGHQVLRIVAVDAKTGEASTLIEETSPTFIDYSQKLFYRHLDATDEILWASERDGWNHLYRFDARTGELKNPITTGEWVVRGVDRVDEEARQIWFRAGGIHPDQDPYHVHHARVNFDGSGLVILTEGDGTHEISPSPDGKTYLDTYSRVDLPPVTELRSMADGRLICELERADWSALVETGWQVPERFVAPGRDGRTEIYGVIFRPTNFDASKKYPVIEQIYAGPQGAFVPKDFSPLHGPQRLAELGFLVVQIDGMGTNWRSKAFHDVCWKNLADAGFPDRIAWMKAAAERHPEMDLNRVGLYGGSAGGQNALGGLLFHPEFYKVAVADCGCHDNRMDKIWWNEQWMGWPVGPEYEASSNVANAGKLRGKLLLTVGELDRNVDPASTMQVVDALIRAGKDFELIVFPGAGHGAGGSPYGDRRRRDFFVRHLLGVQPPDWNGGEGG